MKCQACKREATQHITELEDGDLVEYHVCEEHAKNLPSLKPPRVHSPLVEVLTDNEISSALADEDARKEISEQILPLLCSALSNDRAEVRIQAIVRILSLNQGAAAAIESLAELAEDVDVRVRRMAKAAVTHLKNAY